MKKRFTEEQIIGFLKQAEAGTPIKELCRKHGFSDAAFWLDRRRRQHRFERKVFTADIALVSQHRVDQVVAGICLVQ